MDSDRNRLQVRIQYVDLRVRNRSTDGNGYLSGFHSAYRGPNCRLRWTVKIPELTVLTQSGCKITRQSLAPTENLELLRSQPSCVEQQSPRGRGRLHRRHRAFRQALAPSPS